MVSLELDILLKTSIAILAVQSSCKDRHRFWSPRRDHQHPAHRTGRESALCPLVRSRQLAQRSRYYLLFDVQILPRYRYPVILSIWTQASQGPLVRVDGAFQKVKEAKGGGRRHTMSRVRIRARLRLVRQEDLHRATQPERRPGEGE